MAENQLSQPVAAAHNDLLEAQPMLRHVQNRPDEILCHIVQNEIMYEPDVFGQPKHGEFYVCNPVESDGYISGLMYTVQLSEDILANKKDALASGEDIFVAISGATLAVDSVVVSDSTYMRVAEPAFNIRNRRNLKPNTQGILYVVVVRIIANDAEPEFTAEELYQLLFQDDVSMRTQYEKCSFGKLKMFPSSYGVLDVKVNMNAAGSTYSLLMNAAGPIADSMVADRSVRDVADLIMFVIPPGTGGWAAFATVAGKQVRSLESDQRSTSIRISYLVLFAKSVFNNRWAAYLGGQVS
jgi:hypothetical protein